MKRRTARSWRARTFGTIARRAYSIGFAAASLVASFAARAGQADSVFFIAKSENRNQVHYGMRLDAHCDPIGDRPVYGYWRMHEHGGSVEPILPQEEAAYGIGRQERIPGGIRINLRALPDKPIDIVARPSENGCVLTASTLITGVSARLHSIYVHLTWPFRVDYVLLSGFRLDDAKWIRERL